MIFGTVATGDAAGAILAHGLSGSGWAFKKGRLLSADDVAVLLQAGVAKVVVARLDAYDIGEDQAAAAIAGALAGPGVNAAAAATGRCNLFAATDGVLVVDAECLHRVNATDEAVTVATLPEFARVRPGQMVATVKIIPFAAPRAAVDACSAALAAVPRALHVAPFRRGQAGLIQTRLPGTRTALLRKTETVTAARLGDLGSVLAASATVAHEQAALQAALLGMIGDGRDPILILGASATVDRRDVLPASIAAAGGVVMHFGMPVDPGNLLLLARCGGATVIGMPGCARSPKTNGLDWVLQRLLAGLPVDRAQIVRMGVGGLLMEIPSRPAPREPRQQDAQQGLESPAPGQPRVAVVVLAAGQGTRMPGCQKLLIKVAGQPMLAAAVEAATASGAVEVVVVVGHQAAALRSALAGRSVKIIDNPDYAQGLSSSLRVGLDALPGDVDAVLFMLADMPEVTADHVDRLIAAFAADARRPVCVPVHDGRRGNPVLWPARLFAELRALQGDHGGRVLLRRHADMVLKVPMADAAVLRDIDVPEDLRGLDRTGVLGAADAQ